eukprot:2702227-Amphidinium_carterae.1
MRWFTRWFNVLVALWIFRLLFDFCNLFEWKQTTSNTVSSQLDAALRSALQSAIGQHPQLRMQDPAPSLFDVVVQVMGLAIR